MEKILSKTVQISPKQSQRYIKDKEKTEENDVISMIVDKFCNNSQDALAYQKKISSVRRNPSYEPPLLKNAIANSAINNDLETEREVEKVVK